MREENELLRRRFSELARRSDAQATYTFTDFLGLAEQSVLKTMGRELRGVKTELFGGTDGCERLVARFGSEEELGYAEDYPIACIKALPKNKKYAEALTHRDYLGAILNLGIERETLGDIAITEDATYIFALSGIADFIISNLTRVRHTDLTLSLSEPPSEALFHTEERKVQVSSERLDAVIARVYSLSRDDAQALFVKRLVFADGREIQSSSYSPKEGEIISVRGHGRFLYIGQVGTTRKGRLNVAVQVYV